MLNKRLIAALIVKEGIVVQSIGFCRYLPVGRPEIAVEWLNNWGIDEIVLLDISATPQKRDPDYAMIERVSRKCFAPLTVGGGIHRVEHIRALLRHGADKIVVNTAAIKGPQLIQEASDVFGNQCVVVSLDVRYKAGRYEVCGNSGQDPTGKDPVSMAREAQRLGAGEIFLNSIDRDGFKEGYDLKLIRAVVEAVTIPVIACGGVGGPRHFLQGFVEGKATAVAAGNYFHFIQHSPIVAKAYLKKNGIDMRIDTYSQYDGFDFDEMGRICKRDDEYLNNLRFQYQPKEVI